MVKLWTDEGEVVGTLRPGGGGPGTLLSPALGGQRTGPVTAMAFHPHQPLLAAAGADHCAVYELYDPQVRQEGRTGYGRVPSVGHRQGCAWPVGEG